MNIKVTKQFLKVELLFKKILLRELDENYRLKNEFNCESPFNIYYRIYNKMMNVVSSKEIKNILTEISLDPEYYIPEFYLYC